MFRKLNIFLFLNVVVFVNNVSAQLSDIQSMMSSGYENGTNLNIVYKNDVSVKAYIQTRGVGFLFRQSKHLTVNNRSFYEIDIQSLKHPKEVKSEGSSINKRRFVYGKLNNALLLRASLGKQNVLFNKSDNKSVEVRYAYSVGPIVSFTKPYYVRIYTNASGTVNEEPIRFDSENFNPSKSIAGRSGFSKGLNEMKFYPGINAKFNLSFEYAPFSNLIRALETGVSLDYFPKALPLMHLNQSENLIFTIHLGFVFGTKWY